MKEHVCNPYQNFLKAYAGTERKVQGHFRGLDSQAQYQKLVGIFP